MKSRLSGLDRGELTVLAARLATFGVGPLTVLAIGVFFNPVLQGYYYSFTSTVAASQLFEAGISTALIQIAAHESGRIRFTRDAIESDDATALKRLAGVLRFALGWYGGVAATMAVVVAAAGVLIFSTNRASVNWLVPWILLVAFAAADLGLQAFFVVLEGTGQITETYRYRLFRVVALNSALIISVIAGAQLFSLGLGLAAATAVGIAHLLRRRRFFGRLLQVDARHAVSWRSEILPFQWRVAISWMAGYLSAAAFTPLLLATRGPVEAGQMGMAVLLTSACTSLAASFIQAKAPLLGSLAGSGRWQDLIFLFTAKARRSVMVAAGALASAVLVIALAQVLHLPLADRILPWQAFLIISVGRLAYHVEGVLAFFMRAQKREPYFLLEMVGAALVVPLGLLAVGPFGAGGLCVVFAGVHLLLLLPLAVWILRKDLRRVGSLISELARSQPAKNVPWSVSDPAFGAPSMATR